MILDIFFYRSELPIRGHKQTMCLSVCLSVWMNVCQSVCLSVCVSVCLFVCLRVCLSVCQSVCWMTVCLSVCLSVCLLVCLLAPHLSASSITADLMEAMWSIYLTDWLEDDSHLYYCMHLLYRNSNIDVFNDIFWNFKKNLHS